MGNAKLGLGCWAFGNDNYWGAQNHKDSVKTLQAAIRGGIKHFDTARSYGNGRSEQITGQQLQKYRENVVIATKSTWLPSESVEKYLNISLNRLCTDYVDIFYIHWPETGLDFRPMMEVIEKLRDSGKIKKIGVSNFSIKDMELLRNSGNIDYYQTGYSLLWRFPEKEIIPYCTNKKIKFVSYSSLAQGILTDKFNISTRFPGDDPRNKLVFFYKDSYDRVKIFLNKFKELARSEGFSMAQLSLKWILRQPRIDTVLAGARTRKQLEENLAAESIDPDDEIMQKLSFLSDELYKNIPYRENIF
ncbi:MAG: hypothetical protein DRP58_11365, partial [Spirochaetes bacterium]